MQNVNFRLTSNAQKRCCLSSLFNLRHRNCCLILRPFHGFLFCFLFRFFFLTFTMEKMENLSTPLERAPISVNCQIWKWYVLSERRYSSAKCANIYRRLYDGERASLCSQHKNVFKISRFWGAISSLVFDKSLSNFAILLILRRSFQWCRRVFPNLSM